MCWCIMPKILTHCVLSYNIFTMNKTWSYYWWRYIIVVSFLGRRQQIHIICSVHPRFFTHSFVGQLFLVCLSHILGNFETLVQYIVLAGVDRKQLWLSEWLFLWYILLLICYKKYEHFRVPISLQDFTFLLIFHW